MEDASSIGPGIGAFTIFFILAIVLWLLMRNMNARLRRMTYSKRTEEGQGAAAGPEDSTGSTGQAGKGQASKGQADTEDSASDAAM